MCYQAIKLCYTSHLKLIRYAAGFSFVEYIYYYELVNRIVEVSVKDRRVAITSSWKWSPLSF